MLYGKSLYPPLKFAVKSKTALKKKTTLIALLVSGFLQAENGK